MTIQQMQYYIKVCQYKSFTKAARDLSVSQPGISSAMRELERECGVELFERRNNSLYITDAGVLFLEEVRKLLKQYEQMQTVLYSYGTGYHGRKQRLSTAEKAVPAGVSGDCCHGGGGLQRGTATHAGGR